MSEAPDLSKIDINALVADRKAFNDFVYTPLKEAVVELEKRRKDKKLEAKINDLLKGDIPEPLKEKSKIVMFRQLVSPNYEIRRFVNVADAWEVDILFWEYHNDKFTSNNELKHALGKMPFYTGMGKDGRARITNFNIIDFNTSNGKKISEVKTLWGQSLIDFHHKFFRNRYSDVNHHFFDASKWFKEHGAGAAGYYTNFLSLFIRHAILFENFLLDSREISFTKDIFLPAFINIYRITGLKPIIVALEPTHIEGDKFWVCYPNEEKAFVKGKYKL